MSKTYTGTNGSNTFAATQSGILPIRWWDSWDMYGLGGNDSLTGGPKNDYIDGGEGSDIMIGGQGNDQYVIDHDSDKVIERSGEGTDTVFSYAWSYTLPSFVENLTLKDDNNGAGRNAYGNHLNNELRGNKWANTIRGMGGDDYIVGEGGKDTIYGGDGNDTLFRSGEGSQIYGEAGNDFFWGRFSTGNTFYGGTGNDTYDLTDLNSHTIVENADEGFDTVLIGAYGSESDLYTLPESISSNIEQFQLQYTSSKLVGNSNNNRLLANDNNGSILNGNGGDDQLFGANHNDVLIGGTGNDYLAGGGGDDILSGAGGASGSTPQDWMVGGAGKDIFSLDDFYRGNSGYAVIHDFNPLQGDTIEIHGQPSHYILGATNLVGSSNLDGALYYKGIDGSTDLIAVFRDNTSVSLNQGFEFI